MGKKLFKKPKNDEKGPKNGQNQPENGGKNPNLVSKLHIKKKDPKRAKN